MIEFQQLFEAAFHEFGLWGLVIAFLVLGPGFTYVRTHNTRLKIETKAQELLYQFAQSEHEQANQLEMQLTQASQDLTEAREEIYQLRLDLQQAQHELEHVPQLRERVQSLNTQVDELEAQVTDHSG